MVVTRVQVNHLRNLIDVSLDLHPRLNLIHGENGSGKTSLLESIHMLALARSFRNASPKPLINYEADKLTVFGELASRRGEHHRVGVEKNRKGESHIRVDGQTVNSAAALAEYLPVLSINAGSFDLLKGPAKPRRQLLDWLAFHVEPDFLPTWRAAQACIKQRNSLLRHGRMSSSDLRPWDAQLIELTGKLDQIRRATFEPFSAAVKALNARSVGPEARLEYRPGWNPDLDFSEVLANALERDGQRGYTHYGPHRADIKITSQGHNAGEVLSRGQQKVLVCALVVAQGQVFGQITGQPCVYLVDDLPAELDDNHRYQLGQWLADLDVQVLITGVDKAPLEQMWPTEAGMDAHLFHVEQGQITRLSLDSNG